MQASTRYCSRRRPSPDPTSPLTSPEPQGSLSVGVSLARRLIRFVSGDGGNVKARRINASASVQTPVSATRGPGLALAPALVIAAAYLGAGALWIVLSEWLLARDEQATTLQLLRGLGFVAATAIALYLVLGRMMSRLQHGAQSQAQMASQLREQTEQQRLLAHRLMQAEEDTRRAIAKDLHDGPLQSLTLSFMRLDASTRADETIDARQVSNAMAAIREASDEIRAVVRALHPPLLAELGLAAAVERHCHELTTRTGRDIQFDRPADRGGRALHQDVSIAAFRIAQEAIANAVKHTASDPVMVRLSLDDDSIEVDVTDQGPGFNADDRVGAGLGLLSMRERAESVGGTLTVRSTPAGGTQVHVLLPDPTTEAR